MFSWIKWPYVLEFGTGSEIMANLCNIFSIKGCSTTICNGNPNEIPENIKNSTWNTVYTNHVLEHMQNPDEMLELIAEIHPNRIIHIVPDGNVDDRNSGTPHLHIFNRKNFRDTVLHTNSFISNGRYETVWYGIIPAHRMDSLVWVGDFVKL
jgi:hypothetical protein